MILKKIQVAGYKLQVSGKYSYRLPDNSYWVTQVILVSEHSKSHNESPLEPCNLKPVTLHPLYEHLI